MRSLADASPDGPANLRDAVLTILALRNKRACVLVVNGEIHSALHVTKIDSSNLHAFESPNFGKIGVVAYDGPRFLMSVIPRVVLTDQSSDSSAVSLEERVHIVKVYTGMNQLLLPRELEGLVVEGTGAGNVPDPIAEALIPLCKQIPVVIVSRCVKGFLRLQR